MLDFPENKKIILFDGVCNLCHSTVQYLIKHDKKDVFRFVALESKLGKSIVAYIGISANSIDSIILYEPGVAYYFKSQAIIMIAKDLGGFFNFGVIFGLLPTKFSDFLYDYIAKNRYAWYGKKTECPLPTDAILNKFL